MTDAELVLKKLAEIEGYLRDLRTRGEIERLRSDVKEERFISHTLQLAIQAALDVASHIVSDERLGEPQTNRELFTLLERSGWIDSGLADRLRGMAGFRNILVHGYAGVDLAVVEDVVRHHLADLETYAQAIRGGLPSAE